MSGVRIFYTLKIKKKKGALFCFYSLNKLIFPLENQVYLLLFQVVKKSQKNIL